MKHLDFDVVVVGGGHAGAEAAHACARLGLNIALVTLDESKIGVMSCNPAVGGLGKGHLVREIDALDGILARAADMGSIQYRLLNRSKGPAVQGPRVQADRAEFRNAIQKLVVNNPAIHVIEGEVTELLTQAGVASGVKLSDGSEIKSVATILTTGTFLRGKIHIGDVQTSAGRMGESAADRLSHQMESLGFSFGRLKTGTPPRLDGSTINWDILDGQAGDEVPTMMSFLSSGPILRQIDCGITHTNAATHDIIHKNLSRSAMYGGHIDGVGPRYCPSIEDKVTRFANKDSHQIFLEPESLSSNAIYPNGISTSLPAEVQDAYVHSIVGLENAKILQPGYAIEYDFVNPQGLSPHLQSEALPNLFLAGQINGTTGYEEAAAQGLVAAIGVYLKSKGEDRTVFDRSNSYIGVLIDDLISRGVTEPYRMFTSRAEFRLQLRADNADQRLTPIGRELGCVSDERWHSFSEKRDLIQSCHDVLSEMSVTPNVANSAGIRLGLDGRRRTGQELLAIPGVSSGNLLEIEPNLTKFSDAILSQCENESTYSQYIERQAQDMASLSADLAIKIPEGFDYGTVPGLSNELKGKLSRANPPSLGHAKNIEGVTPASLTAVLLALKRTA